MMNQFIPVKVSLHEGYYRIRLPDELCNVTTIINCGFTIVMSRLFGLSFIDFLRMVRDNYNAVITGKNGYTNIFFDKEKDCNKLCEELNNRWNYWIERRQEDESML